jgi:hypothetical protein
VAGANAPNWPAEHASTVDGKTVLTLGERTVTLPQSQPPRSDRAAAVG